jgi:hypothetical protein
MSKINYAITPQLAEEIKLPLDSGIVIDRNHKHLAFCGKTMSLVVTTTYETASEKLMVAAWEKSGKITRKD